MAPATGERLQFKAVPVAQPTVTVVILNYTQAQVLVAGSTGLVKINTATYATASVQNSDSTTSGINTNITQANIDSFGAVIVNATGTAQSFTLGDPSLGANAVGRVIYVTAANGSNDFTLNREWWWFW